jgi:hypothetical protein
LKKRLPLIKLKLLKNLPNKTKKSQDTDLYLVNLRRVGKKDSAITAMSNKYESKIRKYVIQAQAEKRSCLTIKWDTTAFVKNYKS